MIRSRRLLGGGFILLSFADTFKIKPLNPGQICRILSAIHYTAVIRIYLCSQRLGPGGKRYMELLERASQRKAFDSALAQAQAGQGCIVLVHGEAGIGKTALVEHFL